MEMADSVFEGHQEGVGDSVRHMQQEENQDKQASVLMRLPTVLTRGSPIKKQKAKQLKPKGAKKQVGAIKKNYLEKNKQNIEQMGQKLKNNSLEDITIPEVPTVQNSDQISKQKCNQCREYKNMLFQLANMIAPTSSNTPANQNFVTVKNFIRFGQNQSNNTKQKQPAANQQQLVNLSNQRITVLKIKEQLLRAKLPIVDIQDTISNLIASYQSQKYEMKRLQDQNHKYIRQLRSLQQRSNNNSDIDALRQQNLQNQQLNADLNEQIQEILQINRQLQENCDGFKELNTMLTQNMEQIRYDGELRRQELEKEMVKVLNYFKKNGKMLENLLLEKIEQIKKKFQDIQVVQEETFIRLWKVQNGLRTADMDTQVQQEEIY